MENEEERRGWEGDWREKEDDSGEGQEDDDGDKDDVEEDEDSFWGESAAVRCVSVIEKFGEAFSDGKNAWFSDFMENSTI